MHPMPQGEDVGCVGTDHHELACVCRNLYCWQGRPEAMMLWFGFGRKWLEHVE
jgi:hypothetical protein